LDHKEYIAAVVQYNGLKWYDCVTKTMTSGWKIHELWSACQCRRDL